ncbi:MAG: hypothetical protein HUJ63_00695 [Enterococcus sp.]|nr:hypothetical protein [Enterococcus sp.]
MDLNFDQIYQFLFQSYGGIGVLVLIFLVLSVIAGFALEHRTQKLLDKRKREVAAKYAAMEEQDAQANDEDVEGSAEIINKDEL